MLFSFQNYYLNILIVRLRLLAMSSNQKRKKITLTFKEKRAILKKVDQGVSNASIMNEYNIGRSTLYYIKNQKDKILQATSVSKRTVSRIERRTFHGPKEKEFDQALYNWFTSKRDEGLAISGPMIIAKAKGIHAEMNLKTNMQFSQGWLRSFKSRHGIRQLKLSGEIRSADTQAAEAYTPLIHSSSLHLTIKVTLSKKFKYISPTVCHTKRKLPVI